MRASLIRFAVAAVLIAGLGGVPTPPTAAASLPHEQQFVELINQERVNNGLRPLVVNAQVRSVARAWTDTMMANANGVCSNTTLVHNPSYTSGYPAGWTRASENVGCITNGPNAVVSMHQGFMNSSGHQANILDPNVNQVGIGVSFGPNNLLWVTQNFMGHPILGHSWVGDYAGDGKTDPAVYRPTDGTWYVLGQPPVGWGTDGDVAVPGDYDGDDRTDIAVWRPSNGVWYVRGGVTVAWGTAGDIPVPGDYNRDGVIEMAVFRPSTGVWYVRGQSPVAWGTSGDIPVPADYDGDERTDIAVWRSSQVVWYVRGGATLGWGTSEDVPVPGDYDGNGGSDMAVWRPSGGRWFPHGQGPVQWGTSGDVPQPGDYDNNGHTDIAVWRPSSGVWFVMGQFSTPWGALSDDPLVLSPAIFRPLFRP